MDVPSGHVRAGEIPLCRYPCGAAGDSRAYCENHLLRAGEVERAARILTGLTRLICAPAAHLSRRGDETRVLPADRQAREVGKGIVVRRNDEIGDAHEARVRVVTDDAPAVQARRGRTAGRVSRRVNRVEGQRR